jgi:hypothetical protein
LGFEGDLDTFQSVMAQFDTEGGAPDGEYSESELAAAFEAGVLIDNGPDAEPRFAVNTEAGSSGSQDSRAA